MNYEYMVNEKDFLENQITKLQEKIALLPPGKLICTKNGRYCKWYHSTKNTTTYIPKSNPSLIEKLTLKKYYLLQLQDLTLKKNAVEAYLKHGSPSPSLASQFLKQSPLLKNLLHASINSQSDTLSSWASASYEKNTTFPEQCIHPSCSGHILRSKSEVIIDTALYRYDIPFRYECALPLGSKIFFPDFTIRHPETGEFYYWEHFGMMDHSGYAQNTFSKLQHYTSHGLIPTVNLITTYETKEAPLDSQYVQTLIQHYFL